MENIFTTPRSLDERLTDSVRAKLCQSSEHYPQAVKALILELKKEVYVQELKYSTLCDLFTFGTDGQNFRTTSPWELFED